MDAHMHVAITALTIGWFLLAFTILANRETS